MFDEQILNGSVLHESEKKYEGQNFGTYQFISYLYLHRDWLGVLPSITKKYDSDGN